MKTSLIAWLLLLPVCACAATLSIFPPVSSDMVVQRDQPMVVMGQAAPSSDVSATFAGQTAKGKADAEGLWTLRLPAPALNAKPQVLTVESGSDHVVCTNILVGDVWVCSGQSNMQFSMNGLTNGAEEIAEANHPLIRLLYVYDVHSPVPTNRLISTWTPCVPATAGRFSAVGYFFGRELQQHLNIPIGLIDSTWGGTPAESWTPLPALAAVPAFSYVLAKQAKYEADYPNMLEKYNHALADWQAAGSPTNIAKPKPLMSPDNEYAPAHLYNAMIHPLTSYAVRGFIWYQGESNAGRAKEYRLLLSTMIRAWRAAWGCEDLPFLIVQLAAYMAPQQSAAQPPSDWALLREAQQQTTTNVSLCGIATAIDIGDAMNIHPKNKLDVGRRLALQARRIAYHEQLIAGGPALRSATPEGDHVVLAFDNVGRGLVAHGGELHGFAIAGEDKKFVWAQAQIQGTTVVVSAKEVPSPQFVRYAFSNNPADANLFNADGLPAYPFRTDTP